MKTIFIIIIIIIVILAGLLFGFLLAKLFFKLSTYIIQRKAKNIILNNQNGIDKFLFRQKEYNLKENIEYDLKKYTPWYKRIFQKKMKGGISQYGRTDDAGFIPKPIRTDNGSNQQTNTDNTQQPSTDTAQSSGEQRSINSNLP